MAAAKFLKVGSSGLPTEEATINTSAGAGDVDKVPCLDANGKLSSTMMPTGFGADTLSLISGEALTTGDFVYIDSAAGKIFKADANAVAKAAVGFVLSSVAGTDLAITVYFEGTNTGLSGLTAGTRYFLSATVAGAVDTAIPSGAADIVQSLGVAHSTTALNFEAGVPIVRV